EFVIVMPDCGSPLHVAEGVSEVLAKLSEPYTIAEHVLQVGASAGIAIAPLHGSAISDILSNADLALYQAKKSGGHGYRFFTPALRTHAQSRRLLDLELRRAFARTNSSSITSRWCVSPTAPSPAPRPCCGGAIRTAAWSTRTPSSRLSPATRSPST